MPVGTVLDRLVTVLAFNTDLAGLRRFDDKVRNTPSVWTGYRRLGSTSGGN